MKNLIKFALGAAVAGALVNQLVKKRSGYHEDDIIEDQLGDAQLGDPMRGAGGFIVTELVADESSVGEGSGDDRVKLPDDGRVGRGPITS